MQQTNNQKRSLSRKKRKYMREYIASSKNTISNTLGSDKIEFSYSVLLIARDVLQELVNMETYTDIIDSAYSKILQEMTDVKSKIYFWKSNP